jgi:hypothetical protein
MGILLFFTQGAFAQKKAKNVDIKWSSEKKSKKRSFVPYAVFSHDDTGYYTLQFVGSSKNEYYLFHYDNKLNLKKSQKISFGKRRNGRDLHHFREFNNKIYMFSTFLDNKNKRNNLYVQTINKKTLKPNQDIKKIISFAFKKKSKSGYFNVLTSRDSTKLMVYYKLPNKKNEKEKFGFHVYDKDMNEIWSKQITLPYKNKLFDIKDYDIDNNGAVHILGKLFNKKAKDKRKGKVNYRFQILSYYNNGTELKRYDIRLKGKFVKDVKIAVNDDKDIICAGFYSDGDSDSMKGTYFIKIDHETKEIITESYKKFDSSFITQYMKEGAKKNTKKRMAKGKKVELYHYDLNDIVLKEDGGAVLIGEDYDSSVMTSTYFKGNGGYGTQTTYFFTYNNIIVINISPKGEILWAQKVPKRQTSNAPGHFASYASMITDHKIYLLYNDNPKNLINGENDKGKIYNLSNLKKSVIVLASLDSDGKLTREIIPKPDKTKLFLIPKASIQINDDTMIIFIQRARKYRYAKLTFKE